jgi:hypothetical protein
MMFCIANNIVKETIIVLIKPIPILLTIQNITLSYCHIVNIVTISNNT